MVCFINVLLECSGPPARNLKINTNFGLVKTTSLFNEFFFWAVSREIV